METFGQVVRRHRKRRGWGLRRLGAESGIAYGYIGRIERDEAVCSFDMAQWLDQALGAGGDLLAAHPGVEAGLGPVKESDAMRRRTAIGTMVGLALGAAATPAVALEALRHGLGLAIDTDREGWQAIAHDYGRDFYITPPADLLGQLQVDLTVLQHQLVTNPDDRGLLRVAGQLCVVMAMTVASTGQLTIARRWWRDARDYADRSHDLDTRIWVRDWEVVNGTYEERPIGQILALADESIALADGRVCCGSAGLMSGHAQALAVAGNVDGAVDALRATAELTERMPAAVTADAESMFGWPEVRLRYTGSYVYTHIGDTVRAAEAQDRALDLYGPDPALAKERAQMQMHRAACLIKDRDIPGGLRHAAATLDELPVEHHNELLYAVARQVLRVVPASDRQRVEANDLRERLRALPAR